MRTFDWNALDEAGRRAALERPQQRTDAELQASVAAIFDEVRSRGWDGLRSAALRIDGAEPRLVEVAARAAEAREQLAPEQVSAIEFAARNILVFHQASLPKDVAVETAPGLVVRKVWRAIDRVGLYVPGGTAPLYSTLLMLGLPAQAAGVGEIVVVTPPRPDGSLDPFVALAAELCGVETIWTLGGAQAIAALTFGAGDIPKVDKICGPGNAWVAEAKRLASGLPGGPAIDLPAGPSELMVIADGTADPNVVAADLLSQAEHDASAQVLLVTPEKTLAKEVQAEIERQLETLPRSDIARRSLREARVILTADLDQAVAVANAYAPEHLSLAVEDAEGLVPCVRNAGAVFAGPLAAETFGDYLAGSSHVLPTDGAARAWGGVSAYTFLKAISVQTVTPEGARRIAAPAAILARMEALEAHARAADARQEATA